MNELLKNLKEQNNLTYTTNGAVTYRSTMNKVYDLFATGAAMRQASDDNCISLFAAAYKEDPTLALKCLFWLRDARGGAGERRFFRLAIKWLAMYHKNEMEHLIRFVPVMGRWDDLFELFDTPLEGEMMGYIKWAIEQNEDHLLYKWLSSINASSRNTKERGRKFAREFGLTERQYRKMLSEGRKACNLVETLMSQNRWNEIEFQKLPSRAGILYSKAFARREETAERYRAFMSSDKTTVNAGVLYPYDVVKKAREVMGTNDCWGNSKKVALNDVNRLAANKYWDNLTDYFNGATLNALCVCDTSGSMTAGRGIAPIDVAISLSLYTAERAKGPFQNHFISFSSRPTLIEVEGVDFCDKVKRIYDQNLCENTNIEATFDLVLNTAIRNRLTQSDLPESLIIVSDMQFDTARGLYGYGYSGMDNDVHTLMEKIERKWNAHGYKMPSLVFWNVNAASGGGNIPMKDVGGVTFVSGASPSIFRSVLTGKTGRELMLETICAERYNEIYSIKENVK